MSNNNNNKNLTSMNEQRAYFEVLPLQMLSESSGGNGDVEDMCT